MSDALAPGVWVVPVDTKISAFAGPSARLVVDVLDPPGILYCVSCRNRGGLTLILKGLPRGDGCIGWCSRHWRPINSDITSITRLLTQPIDAGMVGA